MTQRPSNFDSFRGQPDVVENLRVAVRSARAQNVSLGHTLLVGPAGLGKTTLAASVLPEELGCAVTVLNCAAIEKGTDLTPTLSTAKEKSIVFLDEVHQLPASARDHLLTVMEDGCLYVPVKRDEDTTVICVELPPFTIVASTTKHGVIEGPLRSRFRHVLRLKHYSDEDIADILRWHALQRDFTLDPAPLVALSHGIARNAVNLVEACIDTFFSQDGVIRAVPERLPDSVVTETVQRLGYMGPFDENEWRYLRHLARFVKPVGVKSISVALDETVTAIEDIYEPWLIRNGLVIRTSTGRELARDEFARRFPELVPGVGL